LDKDELRRKSDDIVAVFDEEIAEEENDQEIEDFESDLLDNGEQEEKDAKEEESEQE